MTTSVNANEFYAAYDRSGQGCQLKSKHIRQFTKDFVDASGYRPGMSVLELGCGNGLFLRFLEKIGATRFMGVDGDSRVLGEMPPDLAAKVRVADFNDFFASHPADQKFDRVVMFDVLEHFSAEDGAALLRAIGAVLAPGGRIVIRTPNMGSPWGMGVQYNDMTHRACYTPGSLRQVAQVGGYRLAAALPQAYTSRGRELREAVLTTIMGWFLSSPPQIWSPNFIGVLERA
ncbi:MAG: class I SAM-dependent methyltransferase [Magnetospirillum sp.]